MKELTFNEWQAHLTQQLDKDYKKLYLTSKLKNNERIIQKLPRQKARDLRRV